MGEAGLAITCSTRELAFLASLVGGKTLLGIQDPFWGWLAEEIQEEWANARTALAERRFIRFQEDDSVVMDVGVAAIVGACSAPDASFVVTSNTLRGHQQTSIFHVVRGLVVQQIVEGDECRFAVLEGLRAAYNRILDEFGVAAQQRAQDERVTLQEKDLLKARQIAREEGYEGAQTFLRRASITETAAQSMAETLAHPIANGAVVGLALRESAWDEGGIGLLEGANGLWCMRSYMKENTTWVDLSPCDADEARGHVRRFMDRFLPEPLGV